MKIVLLNETDYHDTSSRHQTTQSHVNVILACREAQTTQSHVILASRVVVHNPPILRGSGRPSGPHSHACRADHMSSG